MSEISYEEARILVLSRLRQWLQELPLAERERPRKVIDFRPYSVVDLISECERDTEVGRKYVYDQAKLMGYVVV